METKKENKLWEDAYSRLRDLILSGQLKPGALISENALAKDFGMSRTPVREAIRRLEQEGLIISAGNRRKQVFILTIENIKEIFDIKKALEGGIAGWAAERHDEKDAEKLKKIVANMEKAVEQRSSSLAQANEDGWLRLDEQYHELLFKMSHNFKAEEIIKNLNQQWHRLRLGILAIEGRLEKSFEEHEEIALAILDKNPDAAEKAMKEHLQNLERMLVSLMRTFNFPE